MTNIKPYNGTEPLHKLIKRAALFERKKQPNELCQTYLHVSRYYSEREIDTDKAFDYAEKASALAELLNDDFLRVDCLYAKAVVERVVGNVAYALTLLQNALQILHRLKKDEKVMREQAGIFYRIATLFFKLEELKQRMFYLRKAYKLFKLLNNEQGIGFCYIVAANYYFRNKDYERAIKYNLQSTEIFTRSNDRTLIAGNKNNLGNIYMELQQFDKAAENLKVAIEYFDSNQHGKSMALMNLGDCYMQQGMMQEAKRFLNKAYLISRKGKLKYVLYSVLELQAIWLLRQKRYKLLSEKQHEIIELKNEFFEKEKAKSQKELELRFELQEKDKEARMLKQRTAEMEAYTHKLEMINNELKTFAHVASHDLKEPLRGISSFVELMHRRTAGKLNDEEKEYLNYIRTNTQRMGNIIKDLLEYTQIEMGERSTNYVDVQEVVNHVSDILKAQPENTNVSIHAEKLPNVRANQTEVERLLLNLIANGIKYNKSDKPEVQISAKREDGFYHFMVSDNGIGIPKQHRKKVFEIFQRLHSRNEYSGTGIGLAISKKIVENHGGEIWVDANESGGSVFHFTLPA